MLSKGSGEREEAEIYKQKDQLLKESRPKELLFA